MAYGKVFEKHDRRYYPFGKTFSAIKWGISQVHFRGCRFRLAIVQMTILVPRKPTDIVVKLEAHCKGSAHFCNGIIRREYSCFVHNEWDNQFEHSKSLGSLLRLTGASRRLLRRMSRLFEKPLYPAAKYFPDLCNDNLTSKRLFLRRCRSQIIL